MRAHARRDGLVHVAPEPAGDAAEQRRAVGRALLDGEPLERDLEHGRDDLQPQLAARAAAGDAAALAAADEVERVAQAAGDALEHARARARRGRGGSPGR